MWMITYDAHKFNAAEMIMAFDFYYSYRCTVVKRKDNNYKNWFILYR